MKINSCYFSICLKLIIVTSSLPLSQVVKGRLFLKLPVWSWEDVELKAISSSSKQTSVVPAIPHFPTRQQSMVCNTSCKDLEKRESSYFCALHVTISVSRRMHCMETQQQTSLDCWYSEMEVTNVWFSVVAVNACRSSGTELKNA